MIANIENINEMHERALEKSDRSNRQKKHETRIILTIFLVNELERDVRLSLVIYKKFSSEFENFVFMHTFVYGKN